MNQTIMIMQRTDAIEMIATTVQFVLLLTLSTLTDL